MSSTPENPQQPWQASPRDGSAPWAPPSQDPVPSEQASWPPSEPASAEQSSVNPYADTGSEPPVSGQGERPYDAAQPGSSEQGRWGQPGPSADQAGHGTGHGQAGQWGQPSAEQPAAQSGQPQAGQWGQPSAEQPGQDAGQGQYAPAGQRPPGTDLGSDISASMRWMWSAFTRNLSAFLVPGIVYGILVLLLLGGAIAAYIWGFVSDMQYDPVQGEYTPDLDRLFIGLGIFALLSLLTLIPSVLWQSGASRAAAKIVDGGRPSIGEAFIGSGRVIATVLLVLVITYVGAMLCYLPGIVAGFFLMWAIPAAAHGASPIEAMKESARLAKDNVATSIVTLLIGSAAASIGGSFILPLLVLPALLALFQRGMYERLSGRELVEPEAASTA